MEKIKNFFKRLISAFTKQRKSGFSLIELLVVIGIIGVLAAIAIPAYNNYKDQAGQGALESSLKNIGKSHNICRVTKTLQNCDSLGELDIACDDCEDISTMTSNSYPWCVEAKSNEQKACLIMLGGSSPPAIINNWENPDCTKLYSAFTCAVVSHKSTWTPHTTISTCNGVSSCTTAGTPAIGTGTASDPDTCPAGSSVGGTSPRYEACSGSSSSPALGECDKTTGQCK